MRKNILKKILISITLLFLPLYAIGIEEVKLEKDSLSPDYFSDIYYGKVDNSESVSPILKLFSQKGLELKKTPIDAIKLTFLYDGQLQYNHTFHQGSYFKHDFVTAEPMISLFFNDRKTEATFDYNLLREIDGYSNSFSQKITSAFISHKITDNQTILLGQGVRIPITIDGSKSTMGQDFILKGQIGRTFGDVVSTGVRNYGKYKFADYDIGLYDSTRYMQDYGKGLDFTGHVMLKPFANREDEIKNLKVGTTYNLGDYKTSYSVYSFYTAYDYKKFHITSEYAKADGYNGKKNSNNEAYGFYTTLSYDITPKLSILSRYDYLTANKADSNSYCQEYTAGLTYKLFKNMKFMLNFINKNYSNKSDSNMILFATRFII